MSPEREICPGCHFEWAIVPPEEVTPRIDAAVRQFATVLLTDSEIANQRPEPARWSNLEYGAHLRDVLLLVRDRIILAVIENVPTPFPLYREERVELGLYENDTPHSVASDLDSAARLFTSIFENVRREHGTRTMMYGFPSLSERSVAWTGAQMVHECEHHLDDVRHNMAVLTAP